MSLTADEMLLGVRWRVYAICNAQSTAVTVGRLKRKRKKKERWKLLYPYQGTRHCKLLAKTNHRGLVLSAQCSVLSLSAI
jgi:hypothetical protein